ncbi:MAG TPA: hypothetical protein VNM92_13200, partial [Thermoanaerobaculia bacterium]|nr:hypothetical protein [Thermoanaerobaculia bacterium]
RGRERYEDLALFEGLARLSRPSPCFAPLASLSPPGRGITPLRGSTTSNSEPVSSEAIYQRVRCD